MNDDTESSAEQLLQATSRRLPPSASLDRETADLRAAFLQLGRAVETANSDFDEGRLLAAITSRCGTNHCDTAAELPPQRYANPWPLAVSAALAVAVLVAIVRTAAVGPSPDAAVALPQQPDQRPNPLTSSRLAAWVDPLDDEIASAQDAVETLGGRTAGLDGSLKSFGWRLEALSAELESGSL